MSEAQRFQPRVPVVKALRWDPTDDGNAMCAFLRQECLIVSSCDGKDRLEVVRVDGDAWAEPGDWVVKGTGYGPLVVKPDIFVAMFKPEEAKADATRPS